MTTQDNDQASDADLVTATRAGDINAYEALWRRHHRSALAAARLTPTTFDPDDLVQEVFTVIYHAIQRGGGPTMGFRAYLLTAVRSTASSRGRSRHDVTDDQLDQIIDPATEEARMDEVLDQSITGSAFQSLPTRWQEVLWYTAVEQLNPADVAPIMGLSTTAVSQLAFRAHEGLRRAWVQAHLHALSDDSECKWVVVRLGAYARHGTSRSDMERIEQHLTDCTHCLIVSEEAAHVGSRLALVMLPLVIGSMCAPGYLAHLQCASSFHLDHSTDPRPSYPPT